MKNNKLIAEFMNLELEETPKGEFVYARHEINNPNKLNDCQTNFYYPLELRYNLSWDWLMDVVDEIEGILEEMVINTHGGDDTIEYFYKLNLQNLLYREGYVFITSNINNVYSDVVNFIKWYNNQKTQ